MKLLAFSSPAAGQRLRFAHAQEDWVEAVQTIEKNTVARIAKLPSIPYAPMTIIPIAKVPAIMMAKKASEMPADAIEIDVRHHTRNSNTSTMVPSDLGRLCSASSSRYQAMKP